MVSVNKTTSTQSVTKTNKKDDVTLNTAKIFNKGTKVVTNTYKHGQKNPISSTWIFDGNNFVKQVKGKEKSKSKGKEKEKEKTETLTPEKLFPKGIPLDANGDGKYDTKDSSIFNQMGNQELTKKFAENIHGQYYMKANTDEAFVNKNGSISFFVSNYATRATNTELGDRTNMTERIGYTIDPSK